MKRILRTLKPGLIDSILLGTLCFYATWVFLAFINLLIWETDFEMEIVSSGFAIACLALGLGSPSWLAVWIIYSDWKLIPRLLVGFAASVVLVIAIMMSYSSIDTTTEYTPKDWIELLASIVLSIGILGIIGVVVQIMRWRLTTRNRPLRNPASILQLMFLTAIVAGGLAIVVRADIDESFAVLPLMLLLPCAVYTLPPIIAACALNVPQRSWWVALLWTIVGGAALLALTRLAPAGEERDFAAATIIGGHVGFALSMIGAFFWSRSYGLRFARLDATDSDAVTERDTNQQRRVNPFVFAATLFAVFSFMLHLYLIDTTALILSEGPNRWESAYRIAQVSRLLGTRPTWYEGASWGSGDARYDEATYSTEVDHNNNLYVFQSATGSSPELVKAAVMTGSRPISLEFTTTSMDSKFLEAIGDDQIIESLTVVADSISADDLQKICRRPNIRDINLHISQVDVGHLRVVANAGHLNTFGFETPIPLSRESARLIAELPIDRRSLPITVDRSNIDHLSGLNAKFLNIHDSFIDNDLVSGINPEVVEINFKRCTFGDSVFDALAKLDVSNLIIEFKPDDVPPDSELIKLARNDRLNMIHFSGVENSDRNLSGKVLAHRLNHLMSRNVAFWETSDEHWSNPFDGGYGQPISTDLVMEFEEKLGSLQASLDRVAHAVDRDSDGQITGIDLEGIFVLAKTVERLGTLQRLRSLRISGHDDNDGVRSIWTNVTSMIQLESLEAPAYLISDGELSAIANNLTQLQRLQIPLPILCANVNDLAPDRISQRELDDIGADPMIELAHAAQNGITSYGGTLSHACIKDIVRLQQLRYLFIPGWLLNGETLEELRKLPQLTELHAPLSNLSPALIRKLANHKQWTRLTIGISSPNEEMFKALAELSHLEELTLYVFDRNCHALDPVNDMRSEEADKIEAARGTLTTKVEELLPNCKLQMRFLPKLPSQIDPLE